MNTTLRPNAAGFGHGHAAAPVRRERSILHQVLMGGAEGLCCSHLPPCTDASPSRFSRTWMWLPIIACDMFAAAAAAATFPRSTILAKLGIAVRRSIPLSY